MQKSISKLIFAGYTESKNPVQNRLKIQFLEFDYSKLIFQISITDQQGVNVLGYCLSDSIECQTFSQKWQWCTERASSMS